MEGRQGHRPRRRGIAGFVVAACTVAGIGFASPVGAGRVSGSRVPGGRGAVIVPPSVVHTSWRSPEMMTKDALPRHDVLRDKAVDALAAYENFIASRDPRIADRYQRALANVVSIVAARTFVPRSEMLDAWQSASLRHQKAILVGMTTLGTGYLFGSDNPKKGLDCSGLVAYAWAKAGVALPMKVGSSARPWSRDRTVAGTCRRHRRLPRTLDDLSRCRRHRVAFGAAQHGCASRTDQLEGIAERPLCRSDTGRLIRLCGEPLVGVNRAAGIAQ